MKAGYKKPMIEFEDYDLNTAIASGCQTIVSLGPGDDDHAVCREYITQFSILDSVEPVPENFYEDSCSCYLSAGIGTLFTS